jgi:hypothetical protein
MVGVGYHCREMGKPPHPGTVSYLLQLQITNHKSPVTDFYPITDFTR